MRNIAVAMGNALSAAVGEEGDALRQALESRSAQPSALVREHVAWALERGGRENGFPEG
ncbi:hypothetical protein D9M68_997750 [compost metagenome]